MTIFDDVWVEITRSPSNGRIIAAEVCDDKGQRVNLPITAYEVEQDANDIGVAKFSVHHARVEYK